MKLAITAALIAWAGLASAETYLGNTSPNQYDPDSINNPYGQYGSQYSPDSVNNPYGRYGSQYSNESATNPYAQNAPRLYDQSGNKAGRLTANPYHPGTIGVQAPKAPSFGAPLDLYGD